MKPLQLNPPLWLYVPELEMAGLAHAMTWPSLEESIHWTIFLDNGAIVTLPNERVRGHNNYTVGRGIHERLIAWLKQRPSADLLA